MRASLFPALLAPIPAGGKGRSLNQGWYGRGATGGVTPSTQAGLPCDTIVTLELVNPGDVASMTEVPA